MSEVNPMSLFGSTLATGFEKDLLRAHLRLTQQALLWKVDGLGDVELRRPMTRTGTNLIGIVKHLTGVTYGYLCTAFGRERETFAWEYDEELFYGLDMWATPDESPSEIIAAFGRACDAAAETIDALDLEATGTHHTGVTVSLRWMILVVLADTLRHCGHADVVREMSDGRVGTRPHDGSVSTDEEYLEMYRARITGELDREAWMAYNRAQPGYDQSAWTNFRQRVDGLYPQPETDEPRTEPERSRRTESRGTTLRATRS